MNPANQLVYRPRVFGPFPTYDKSEVARLNKMKLKHEKAPLLLIRVENILAKGEITYYEKLLFM